MYKNMVTGSEQTTNFAIKQIKKKRHEKNHLPLIGTLGYRC